MKNLLLSAVLVTLPLLLGGCGEKPDGVNAEEVEDRDGIAYLKGSDTPYTGKVYGFYHCTVSMSVYFLGPKQQKIPAMH